MLSLLSSQGGLLVAPHAKTSHLSRRAANAPSMVSSWYDSGLRLDGSVAKIQMSADIDDGSAAALEALDALEARLDAVSDAAAPEAETNFYSFLNAEVTAQGSTAAGATPAAAAETPSPAPAPPAAAPPASAPPASAAAAELPALKASFRLKAAQCDRGFSASGTRIEQLQDMAKELEAAAREDPRWADGSAVTASPLLLGKWYLDFCDAGEATPNPNPNLTLTLTLTSTLTLTYALAPAPAPAPAPAITLARRRAQPLPCPAARGRAHRLHLPGGGSNPSPSPSQP